MAVQLGNSGDKVKSVETKTDTPAEKGVTKLELALFNRWTRKGILYEKGVIYTFSDAEAKEMLLKHDHGKPIWVRHKPKPRARLLEVAPKEVDMTASKPENSFKDATAAQITRLELGDESELEAEGIDLNAEDDDGPGVSV